MQAIPVRLLPERWATKIFGLRKTTVPNEYCLIGDCENVGQVIAYRVQPAKQGSVTLEFASGLKSKTQSDAVKQKTNRYFFQLMAARMYANRFGLSMGIWGTAVEAQTFERGISWYGY